MDPGRDGAAPWARLLADALTVSRLLLGFIILLLGLYGRRAAGRGPLSWIVGCNMAGWTTDFADGPLARYSGIPPSKIGRSDFLVDMVFTWATACALALAAGYGLTFLVLYFLLYLIVYARTAKKATSMAFAAPLEALPLLAAFGHSTALGFLYVLWIAACLLVFWVRFIEVLEEFLDDLPPTTRARLRGLLGL